MPTQKEKVLEHLRGGDSLTSLEAVHLFGITRLAARVYELRQDGHPIRDESITKRAADGTRATFSRYYLGKRPGKRRGGAPRPRKESPQAQAEAAEVPFGDLSAQTRFEMDGHEWKKRSLFEAVCLDAPRLGVRDVAPGAAVQPFEKFFE